MTATIPAAQPVDANGRTIEDVGPSIVTTAVLQNAANGTTNGIDFDITGSATVQILVIPTSSYTGTVTFNASPDGVNFDVIQGNQQGTSILATSVVCSSGTITIWNFQTSALKAFRASIGTDSTSGHTVTVTGYASNVPNSSPLAATITSTVLGAGSNVVGKVLIETNSGVALTADQTNSILRASLYGKAAAAADTPIKVNAIGEVLTLNGGTTTTPVAAAAAAAAIKASAGALHKIVVTTLGTAALSFYDNATTNSGTILFTIPASAAVGSIYDIQFPAANGIWCASGTNTPAVTVGWS